MKRIIEMALILIIVGAVLFLSFWTPSMRLKTTIGLACGAIASVLVLFAIVQRWRLDKSPFGYVAVGIAGAVGGTVFALLSGHSIILSAGLGTVSLPLMLLIERVFGPRDFYPDEDET